MLLELIHLTKAFFALLSKASAFLVKTFVVPPVSKYLAMTIIPKANLFQASILGNTFTVTTQSVGAYGISKALDWAVDRSFDFDVSSLLAKKPEPTFRYSGLDESRDLLYDLGYKRYVDVSLPTLSSSLSTLDSYSTYSNPPTFEFNTCKRCGCFVYSGDYCYSCTLKESMQKCISCGTWFYGSGSYCDSCTSYDNSFLGKSSQVCYKCGDTFQGYSWESSCYWCRIH